MLTIRKGGHSDLSHIYSAFDMDFDKRELLPKLAIHKGLLHGDLELLLFEEDQTRMTLGYALVFPRGVYGYALLKYFGILPWYREKGVGVQAMRLLHKHYADKQGILAELTVFDYAAYKEKQYDLLADGVRQNLDMKMIYRILEEGI